MYMTDLVSVVIPTFNRFDILMTTIQSVKAQTYGNIEIIVVNDNSNEGAYYEYDWAVNGIHIIHLESNTKEIFGYACVGHVRNIGIQNSSGKYIAFCDDDDLWFPNKIKLQVDAMKRTGCKMSSTDGLFGVGIYDRSKSYKVYNAEHYYDDLRDIYRLHNSTMLDDGFPEVWDLNFMSVTNCMVCSSVIVEKDILYEIQGMKCTPMAREDYDCWLRALEHTNSVYVKDICFYYDGGHGNGKNY